MMHPLLSGLLGRVADEIERDPEGFERRVKTEFRRVKRKLNSRALRRDIKNFGMRLLAQKMRRPR